MNERGGRAGPRPDVFLHIGLSKTGTTTVQAELERQAEALSRAGVLFPGGRHRTQRLAVYDLLGQRVRGDNSPAVAGSFGRLVAEINAYRGHSVVISEEELALARPRHVRRLVRSLPEHRLFVIVTVRDLARTLVSAWNQSIVMGGTCDWPAFLEAARDPTRGAAGLSFWVRHDVLRVLDTWCSEFPPERVRLVTVPPSGAPPNTLLDRFTAAAELPAGILLGGCGTRNASLGAAELETIRRLNQKIVGPLNTSLYRHVIEQGIRPRLDAGSSRPLQLPAEHWDWVRWRSAEIVRELERRHHPVFGDLNDLRSTTAGAETAIELSDHDMLAAAEAELASLALAYGALTKRYRRAFRREQQRWPTAAELVESSSRAALFHLQKRAVNGADHRLLNWAGRVYLKHTSTHAEVR